MDVDPSDSFSVKFRALEKFKRLAVAGKGSLGYRGQQAKDLSPIPEVPASQFSEDEHMAQNPFVAEQGPKLFVPTAEVIDPDGGVDQDHAA